VLVHFPEPSESSKEEAARHMARPDGNHSHCGHDKADVVGLVVHMNGNSGGIVSVHCCNKNTYEVFFDAKNVDGGAALAVGDLVAGHPVLDARVDVDSDGCSQSSVTTTEHLCAKSVKQLQPMTRQAHASHGQYLQTNCWHQIFCDLEPEAMPEDMPILNELLEHAHVTVVDVSLSSIAIKNSKGQMFRLDLQILPSGHLAWHTNVE